MRTIIMTIGLPASGKTTWAKELLKREPGRFKRINRDDLRWMLDDVQFDQNREDFITQASNALVRQALQDGYDVVLDNTHLNVRSRHQVHKLAQEFGDVTVIEKVFPTPIKTCHERNEARPNRVPASVIDNMAARAGIDRKGYRELKDSTTYHMMSQENANSYVADEGLPKAILCDLDGTLALIGDRSPYDASKCDVVDLPNVPVIECVKAMYKRGYKIVFVSGREDQYREATERFIRKHVRVKFTPEENDMFDEDFINYELHMRSTHDNRKDAIIKRELFDKHVRDKYNVLFVLDDRDQVVKFWRSLGLACFQVQYGDF